MALSEVATAAAISAATTQQALAVSGHRAVYLHAQLAALEQQRAELEAQNFALAHEPGLRQETSIYARLLRRSALAQQIAALWRRYGADLDWNLRGLLPTSKLVGLDALEQPLDAEEQAVQEV